jgi:hypothetical protein
LTVVGHEGIDPKLLITRPHDQDLHQQCGSPPDAIYVGMVVDNNASQF